MLAIECCEAEVFLKDNTLWILTFFSRLMFEVGLPFATLRFEHDLVSFLLDFVFLPSIDLNRSKLRLNNQNHHIECPEEIVDFFAPSSSLSSIF